MKVILLAAGLGKRLRPITNKTPKCLVKIKGKPLLQIWLENLVNAGLKSFLINTHYLSNQVEDYIYSSLYKDYCILKKEDKLLGTAGTLLNNLKYIGNADCLLIHADNYSLQNIEEFIEAHKKRPKKCLMTMMTFKTNSPSTCGIVELDSNNIVIDFHEKKHNSPGNLANAAIYILTPELINILKNDFKNVTDFSTEVIHKFLGKIYTFETKSTFIDIGTPDSYHFANSI